MVWESWIGARSGDRGSRSRGEGEWMSEKRGQFNCLIEFDRKRLAVN